MLVFRSAFLLQITAFITSKTCIFGGLDGILTSFSIVSSATGSHASPELVMGLGMANLIANAFGMAVGEFLSDRAENEWIAMERAREEWEFSKYPSGEIDEMVEIFHEKHNLSSEHAKQFVGIMSQYPEFMVDMMMIHEIGVDPEKAISIGKKLEYSRREQHVIEDGDAKDNVTQNVEPPLLCLDNCITCLPSEAN